MSATPRPPLPAEIREYLLRRMADADRARFEAAYFADDGLLDQIELAEDQLVSDYVLGRLTESDRRRFEGSLLGMPYYKERVETTTRLRRRISRHELFQGTRARQKKARAPAEDGLFPGRTGTVVLIALLATLLAASIVSAIRLKKELQRASRKTPPVAAPAAPSYPPGLAVIPATQTLVLDADGDAGPPFKRVSRPSGAPLVLALARRLLPAGARQIRVTILDDTGHTTWDSGPQPTGGERGDFALRLPPGVPPQGRSAIRITPLPPFSGSETLAAVVFIEDAASP